MDEYLDGLITPEVVEDKPEMPDVGPFREMYRNAYEDSSDDREQANQCLDYYHGNQLSTSILAELRRRRQPPMVNNKIRPAIDGVLGLLDSGQIDPKAVGRNEADEEAALLVTQLLRYAQEKTQFHTVEQDVSFDYFVCGVGASIEEYVDDDVMATHIPYDQFFWDPASKRHDFGDAQYLGRAAFVNKDKAKRMFPEHKDIIGGLTNATFDGSGPENQPEQNKIWLKGRDSVLLVEMYYIDEESGQWCHVNFCHGGVLDYGISPYSDGDKLPACPIKAITYQIDRDNIRYGLIKDMLKVQDSINARESRMLNLTNSSQVQARDGSALPSDRETARKEASKADGAMPMGWERLPVPDIFQQNAILLQGSMETIERMAPSPALLGRTSGANQSGRQSQILQQAGMSELARAFARWETWQLQCFRMMWYIMRDHMGENRMIRVTDEAGLRTKLHVNVPTGEVEIQIDPETGAPTPVPVMENVIADLDMDVNITTTRQVETLRGEAVQAMFDFCARAGISPLSPDFEMVLEMSDLPSKPLLLARYRELVAKKAQADAAQAQQQMEIQKMQMEIQQRATESTTVRNATEAEKNTALAHKHTAEAASAEADAVWKNNLLQAGMNPNSEVQ